MLYYRPELEVVPLDTHILKYLAERGYTVPKSTPPAGKTYLKLETAFIKEARKRKMTVKELDTWVWQTRAIR